ncbi:MAG: glycerophosphodiester phosphodiesterase family protein, partial [Maritimibacter sp.]
MSTLPEAFLRLPIAHRAYHDVTDGRPENSRAAIRAAIARGYGIEIDVQLSADGQAMVFHDYVLDRLTGERGPVRQKTAAELGAIPLIGGDEGIPT